MSADTASLVANARQQIARLLTQLADLEDAREVRATARDGRRGDDGRMRGTTIAMDGLPTDDDDDDDDAGVRRR